MHKLLRQSLDLSTAGGQSQIALTRAERNQKRLNDLGLSLDDNMASDQNALTTENFNG